MRVRRRGRGEPEALRPFRDEAADAVAWFLAGLATALAGGIVFVLTRDGRLAVLAGVAVLVVLRLAHAGAR